MTWFAIVFADYDEATDELDCGIEGIYDSLQDAEIIMQELQELEIHDYMKIEAW